ncbi:MAG: DUF1893 domain-containing protein [Elusimicrobiota bacterium]|jgi:hypothetical protein|nr:DUF1893 domain-containing protein [Elusimicrobiota bacterium]
MKIKFSFKPLFALAAAFILAGCAQHGGVVSLQDIKEMAQNHALVVAYDDGTIATYDDNGIKPLFRHIAGYGDFKGAYVFDKITGRASALVLAYGGARKLYTGILSKEAIPVLEEYNIAYDADELVDFIYNNDWDGLCPMEQSVADIQTPQQAYIVLKEKFSS